MNDFQLDNNQDLKIENGDFVLADSTDQNVELLFRITPGELKEHLETGVAIDRSINGNIDRFLDRTIRVQMEADGYEIDKLEINENGIVIEGSYE
jgi:hypothetical protein